MRISVAMAVYHGEAYLDAQLSSILSQLEPEDEIIVSDDCPGGKTEEIVRRFAEQDQRVHYVQGPGRGLIANFGTPFFSAIRMMFGCRAKPTR